MKNAITKHTLLAGAFAAVLSACSVEPFESAIQRPDYRPEPGRVAFRADLTCGEATRSDYETFQVEQPSTGKTVEVEMFLRPMSGGTMSGIVEAPVPEAAADGLPEPESACGPYGADAPTRSAPVETMYGSFDFVAAPYSMKTAYRSATGYYTVSGLRYCDFEDPTRFFCWAPHAAEGVSWDASTGRLAYVTPSDVTLQPDLVVARSGSVAPDFEDSVPLTFRHALAGIQVKTASIFPDCTVNSVTLKNVCGSGEYDPETGTWTVDPASLMDIELVPAAKTGVTTDYTLAADDYTAMIIPQVLPAGAEIAITLTFRNVVFDYALSVADKTVSGGDVLELSLDGRSMFLLEGTASGPFVITGGTGSSLNKVTITPDEHGKFEALIPYANRYCFHDTNNPSSWLESRDNTTLLTVTRVPDHFDAMTSFTVLFHGCVNLREVCDLGCVGRSGAKNIDGMFRNCESLVSAPWMETAAITSFARTFTGCTSLVDVPLYDTGNVKDFDNTFKGCTSLTSVPAFDTSSATQMSSIFFNCTNLTTVPMLQTSNVTNFTYAFTSCSSLQAVPLFDTSKATTMNSMFRGCSSLTAVPAFDTSNCRDFSSVFYGCRLIQEIPWFDLSKVTTLTYAFYHCDALRTLPEGLDTSECIDFSSMLHACSSLMEMPWLDTSKGISFQRFMNDCVLIEHLPDFDLSNGVNLIAAFSNMTSLNEVPASFRFTSATNMDACFSNCTNLREVLCPLDFPVATNINTLFSNCSHSDFTLPSVLNAPEAVTMKGTFLSANLRGKTLTVNAPKNAVLNNAFVGSRVSAVNGINFGMVNDFRAAFAQTNLTTLSDVDLSGASSAANLNGIFNQCPYLTEFEGTFTGPSYSFDLSTTNLSHDSLLKVVNGLPTVTGGQVLKLDSLLPRLSTAEQSIATAKGWTLQ